MSDNPFGSVPPDAGSTLSADQAAYLREHAQMNGEQAAQVDSGTMPILRDDQLDAIRFQPPVEQQIVEAAGDVAQSAVEALGNFSPQAAEAAQQVMVTAADALGAAPAAGNLSQPLDLSDIVVAAQTLPPFKDIIDPIGEGVLSQAQKMPIAKALDAAGKSAVANAALVSVGFNLPLLAFEIIRDFWQIMALVIAVSFSAPFEIENIFGRIAFFISLDFALIVPVDIGTDRSTIYHCVWWVMFVATIILTVLLRKLVNGAVPDPRREFAMLRTWAMMDRSFVRKMRAVTFLLTLLYLPVSQSALELVTCSHKYEEVTGHCPHWIYFISGCVAVVVMTIALPVQLFNIIRQNVPKEREFDLSGEPNKNPEQGYITDLAKKSRKNPVASLFNEYNRSMRFHKVTIMLLKCYLIVVAVLLSGNNLHGKTHEFNANGDPIRARAETPDDLWNHLRPALMIAGLLVYTVVCIIQRPFIATLANVLDVLLRISAIIAITCTYMIAFDVAVGVLVWVFNGIMILMLLVSVVFIICSFDAVQEKFRRAIGDVKLTPVSEKDSTPLWFQPGHVDYNFHRKTRVWQDFWTNLLLHAEPFALRPPAIKLDEKGEEIDDEEAEHARIAAETGDFEYVDNDDTVAYLLDFKGSVAERHMENLEIAADVGAAEFHIALSKMTNEETQSVIYATRQLHGRDCWMNHASNGTGQFGCLYILPVPYECFFAPDDGGEETRCSTVDMISLIQQNSDGEIQRRRRVREQLRGLALECERGYQAYYHFQRMQDIKVPDGTDSQGRTKYKTVSVLVTYTHGSFHITAELQKPVFRLPGSGREIAIVPGFACGLTYQEGTYTEHGGGTTGQTTIGHAEMGITADFAQTQDLDRLIQSNLGQVKTGHMDVLRMKDSYRRFFQSEFLAKALTLSYAFWPFAFNNDHVPKQALQEFLSSYEFNPHVRTLGAAENVGVLETPFQRLAYYDACPATALWTCFWHDLYYSNLDMSLITEDPEVNGLLNPFMPTSISWNIMCKDGANEALRKVGLQDEGGGGFIQAALMDKLYDAMAYSMDTFSAEAPNAHVEGLQAAESKKPFDFYEVMRQPEYGASVVPCTMENFNHPGLQLVTRLGNGATNSFYEDDGSTDVHFQRYPIVAETFGGKLPDDAYYP